MSCYQSLLEKFKGRGPLINIILDGFGIGKQDHTDAIFQAQTPFIDSLRNRYATTTLATHGLHVGLPGKNDLGGSEVGHLTIGAGMILAQGPTLIQREIEEGSFFESPVLRKVLEIGKSGSLHLMGLLSDGNVHSHISHFEAVIQEAAKSGVQRCFVHALLDGRDVGIQSATQYTDQLESLFADIKQRHPGYQYAFASGGGREVITMDRDQNWGKVELGWKCHVLGQSGNHFPSINAAIQHFRDQIPDLIDQDCPPFNLTGSDGKIPRIQDGDAVLMMNFRGDRAIEISQAFTQDRWNAFPRGPRPDVYFAGMTVYDEDTNLPEHRIIHSPKVDSPFGRRILEYGMDQFRLTETQKFAHVTFFFNGGYRNPLDDKKELYHLIDSDKIPSFADAPQMKAEEIARKAVNLIEESRFHYGLINFANADMVGHTGDMKASIQAVEALDKALRIVCEAVKKMKGIAIITADHGNADEMLIVNPQTGREEMSTKHSINRVPLILYDPLYQNDYRLKQSTNDHPMNLSMIAATNHILLGRQVPDDLNRHLFDL